MHNSSHARFVRNKRKSETRQQYRPMGIKRNEIRGLFEFERASLFFTHPVYQKTQIVNVVKELFKRNQLVIITKNVDDFKI